MASGFDRLADKITRVTSDEWEAQKRQQERASMWETVLRLNAHHEQGVIHNQMTLPQIIEALTKACES